MRVRFLTVVQAETQVLFQPGQILVIDTLTEALQELIAEGRAELLPDPPPDAATLPDAKPRMSRHVH